MVLPKKTRRIIRGDCLEVFDDDLIDTASVDLIYLDPPFNSKQVYKLPFQALGQDTLAVDAFYDIWQWDEGTDDLYERLRSDPDSLPIVQYLDSVATIRGQRSQMLTYLVNMASRLLAMRRILTSRGSIYLHCDPVASHYLRILMDAIFGKDQMRREIIWRIGWISGYKSGAKNWIRNHDVILYYTKTDEYIFNKEYLPYPPDYVRRDGKSPNGKGVPIEDTWNCYAPDQLDSIMIKSFSNEKVGYPTQKPVALLERIIKASSNESSVILDPFCGCGTTLHAAEKLRRNWIGIDISRFATGVIRNRLAETFIDDKKELHTAIKTEGLPVDANSARRLADDDKFEFEKWVCGQIGAKGLYKRPGDKGADGGIDGVIEFFADKDKVSYAIVQVKGGGVSPNDVKSLFADVDREPKATAGVFVCFEKYKKTFENNRSVRTFTDNIAGNKWPVIQLVTVEDLLAGVGPKLPNIVITQRYKTKRHEQISILR